MICPQCGGMTGFLVQGDPREPPEAEVCQVCDMTGTITRERYIEVYGEEPPDETKA